MLNVFQGNSNGVTVRPARRQRRKQRVIDEDEGPRTFLEHVLYGQMCIFA